MTPLAGLPPKVPATTTDDRRNAMPDDTPLLDTLADMTAASVSRVQLSDRELMLVRYAALAAVDAPPASYLLSLPFAVDAGLTIEDARSILIALAPIVGAPAVVKAAKATGEALGFALDLLEAEAELEA
jgi:alkylhydroperoxidase/carboxymuconolactone decarboxylase family protein YurZ